MGRSVGFRKYISCFLLLLGLSLVLYSMFSRREWRSEQQNLLALHDAAVLAEMAADEMGEIVQPEGQLTTAESGTDSLNHQEDPQEKTAVESRQMEEKKKTTVPVKARMKPMAADRRDYEDGMMVVSIPKLEVRAAVIGGTGNASLKKGPGLYENSPLPGQETANVCIAAHRNMYGSWFRYLERLRQGDEVVLECSSKKYVYEIEKVFTISQQDWSVTDPAGYAAVTLTTCSDRRNADKRIAARGRLREIRR